MNIKKNKLKAILSLNNNSIKPAFPYFPSLPSGDAFFIILQESDAKIALAKAQGENSYLGVRLTETSEALRKANGDVDQMRHKTDEFGSLLIQHQRTIDTLTNRCSDVCVRCHVTSIRFILHTISVRIRVTETYSHTRRNQSWAHHSQGKRGSIYGRV